MANRLHPRIFMENQFHSAAAGTLGSEYWTPSSTTHPAGFVVYNDHSSKATSESYPQAFYNQGYWQKQHQSSTNWYTGTQSNFPDFYSLQCKLRQEDTTTGNRYPSGPITSLAHPTYSATSRGVLQSIWGETAQALDQSRDPLLSGLSRQGGSDSTHQPRPNPSPHQHVPTRPIPCHAKPTPNYEVVPVANGEHRRRCETPDAAAILEDINPSFLLQTAKGFIPGNAEWPQGHPVPREPISPKECAGTKTTDQEKIENPGCGTGSDPGMQIGMRHVEPEKEEQNELTSNDSPNPAKRLRTSSPGPESPVYSEITTDSEDDDTNSETSTEDYIETAMLVENPKASDEPQQFSTALPPLPSWCPSFSSISSKNTVITKHSVSSIAAISPSMHKMQRTLVELYPRPVRRPHSSNILTNTKTTNNKNVIMQAQKLTPKSCNTSREPHVQLLLINPQEGLPVMVNKAKYPLKKVRPILSQEETLRPESTFTCCQCIAHRWDILFNDSTEVMATSITAASNGSKHLNVSTTQEYHRWDIDLPEDGLKWSVYLSYTNFNSKRVTCEHYILG